MNDCITVKYCGSNEPKYQTAGASGCDLVANVEQNVYIKPNERVIIPTGLFVEIPEGYEGQVRSRSGLAAKHGIFVLNSPGTIDCFHENSLISTIEGKKTIHDLKINDVVLSFNEKTFEVEKDVITAIVDVGEKDVITFEIENDLTFTVTKTTLVYTQNGLKFAQDITTDDHIIVDLDMIKLAKILKITNDNKKCYDITVSNNHNFFCNNVLIHNCDYRGEIKVILFNTSQQIYCIEKGDRIAQLVFTPIIRAAFEKVSVLSETDRGEGKFGSTGISSS